MASWYLDDTETLRKHRVNFRKAIVDLTDYDFPEIHVRKRAALRDSLDGIERELRARGEDSERSGRAFPFLVKCNTTEEQIDAQST